VSAFARLEAFVRDGEPPPPASPEAARALVLEAQAQGLAALLDQALARQRGDWPAEPLALLRQAHRAAAFRGERQQELLRRARALLADAGVRSQPMKGAALVGCAYDVPAERPMDDVDLLALEDFPGAVAALRRAGFVPLEQADHATALRDPASGFALELHRGLASCPEMFPLDASLWERRSGDTPSAEDLLVQLSVHAAFQHGLRLRLVQFLDFRRLFERAAIDCARVLDLARAAHAEACLFASLEAARRIVAAPVPEALRDALRRRVPRGLLRRVAVLPDEPPALRALAAWRLALVGQRRLELVARTLLPSRGRRARPLQRGLFLLRRLAFRT
jgi:hypothetical protein